ncbi:MAG: hypothetical protein ACLQGP_36820 [Isosphaeraceae bacterium]
MEDFDTEGGQDVGDSGQLSVDDFYPASQGQETFDPAMDPGSDAGSVGQETPGDTQASLRAMVEGLGYRFGDQGPGDDYDTLQHLVEQARGLPALREQARQAEAFRGLGQAIGPRAGEVQAFLSRPPERQPWQPPEWNPEWANLVARDPGTGMFVGLPGAPVDVAERVNAYVQWRDGFLADPAKAIQPMVEERARAIVREELSQRAEGQQQYARVAEIARQNADWFYVAGQDGQPAIGTDGRALVSQVGQHYLALVREAGELGIADPAARNRYATRILESHGAIGDQGHQARQQPAGRQGQAHGEGRQPAKIQRALDATEQARQPQSFAERMRSAMVQEGITDKDLMREDFWNPTLAAPNR